MLVSIKALYFSKDKLINQTFDVMIKHMPFKFFVYSILISLVFACKNDTKIVENKYLIGSDTINFQWQKLKQGGITINHGAILIPVTLEGIDKTFKMQLDLGINHNVIYGDTLAAITSMYPELQNNIQHRDGYNVFYNVSSRLSTSFVNLR